MQRYAGDDPNAVYDIVTGDESWIYCYDLETKRQSAQCVFSFEKLFTKTEDGGRASVEGFRLATFIFGRLSKFESALGPALLRAAGGRGEV
ncbi:hypothetical protein EVAR_37594_1 [Eumeta japonica]|uniref:Mariner Mos1 transposase n=1 Tax=Eumeta variegata TaxID=151549 RepID=A0A4C1VNB1_EUMVA|nr:hypothetical protein EVAR_37594_1 [Eumeta japonica]